MAQTASPRAPSPMAGVARGASPTPPPLHHHSQAQQPVSKRDKRRSLLSEKLNDIVQTFSANHYDHYYAMLSALQCDINLVLRADPYRDAPLPDTAADVAQLVAEARNEITANRPISEEGESSFSALAGQFYAQFVLKVNEATEERDKELTELFNEYQTKFQEHHLNHTYRVQLAHEEHALLSKQLRDRLITAVSEKRRKLLRDKEQLDIADSNALLLNPVQFSIGNTMASPGGPGQNRKTRHTRGRAGENGVVDDTNGGAGGAALQETAATAGNNKRKRKANTAFDDDNGSPGPTSKSLEPLADARARQVYAQFDAPLYSIERLFSEKELALNLNQANIATARYFQQMRTQGITSRLQTDTASNAVATTTNGRGVNALSDLADVATGTAAADDTGADSPVPPPSQPITRSSNRNAAAAAAAAASTNSPLHDLASTATAVATSFPSVLSAGAPPFTINVTPAAAFAKGNAMAPSLPTATEAELNSDLHLIRRGGRSTGGNENDEEAYQALVALSCERVGPGGIGIGAGLANLGGATAKHFQTAIDATAISDGASIGTGVGAASMSRTTSGYGLNFGGFGALGGVAMSKTNSQAGYSDAGARR